MNPQKAFLLAAIVLMSSSIADGINSFPEPNSYPDFNSDKIVNLVDFAIFAGNWKKSGSGLKGDFDKSGTVDTNDLATFAYFWLNGPHPVSVFGSFKAALAADDLDKALTFIADMALEKYTSVLTELRPEFQNMVAGMGDMVLISHESDVARYEMLHDEGGGVMASFPVYFCRDENGNWKMYCF